MVQCERAKIDQNNAAIATTQNTYSMAPLQCDLTKAQQCEQIKAITTDSVSFVFVSNVNTQERILLSPFL